MLKSLNINSKKSTVKSRVSLHFIEIHIFAQYFHTARITCGYMWKSLNINSKKSTVKSRVSLRFIELHIFAQYFQTARITCGYMWKSLNINSKNSTVTYINIYLAYCPLYILIV